jgi:hypothetical protein
MRARGSCLPVFFITTAMIDVFAEQMKLRAKRRAAKRGLLNANKRLIEEAHGIRMKDGRIITAKGVDLTDKVKAALYRRRLAWEHQAEQEQNELRALMEKAPLRTDFLDMGEVVLRPSARIFAHWAKREGTADCWGDKKFRKDLARDNPNLVPPKVRKTNRVSFAGCNHMLVRGKPAPSGEERVLVKP